LPLLYTELANWFHLLTAPEDYAEEADFYRRIMMGASESPLRTVLELGSGGGNNAYHLKKHFEMTLVDMSNAMLDISRRINPECVHIQGDMRYIRLGQQFDAIFIHDAISYLTTKQDIAAVIETVFVHCRPGGVTLFVPDHTLETFAPSTSHGGHDTGNRGLRYLSWVHDPDPDDTTYIMDMVYLLKEDEAIRCQTDRHIMGLFSKDDWRNIMNEAGFSVQVVDRKANWLPPMGTHIFLGIKLEK
jgi:SAM-dependent methyltransferase